MPPVGITLAVEKAVAQGVSRSVAYSRALVWAAAEITVAVRAGMIVAEVVPDILKRAGLDDADVAAGLAIFAAISGLVGLRAIKTQWAKQSARSPGSRGVWDLKWPHGRNEMHWRLGQNVPWRFKVIDILVEYKGIVISIKSLDLQAKKYVKLSELTRVVRGYIDEVAAFNGGEYRNFEILPIHIRGRGLKLAVPPGATAAQTEKLREIIEYGRQLGVIVEIVEVPW